MKRPHLTLGIKILQYTVVHGVPRMMVDRWMFPVFLSRKPCLTGFKGGEMVLGPFLYLQAEMARTRGTNVILTDIQIVFTL